MSPLAQHIQALLFTAGEAVSLQDIGELTSTSEQEVGAALQEILQAVEGSGISLVITATHTQLVTSPAVAPFLAQFETSEEQELSRAAMETLSLIAYRGPISRFDVDVIRGVDSRRMIRQLHTRGLVRQIRSAGKTPLYDVTEEFLTHIGITKREDLPGFAELSSHEQLTRLLHKES
jgi:segregation and condensation protein B